MYSSAYRFLVHKSEIPDIHVNMIIEFRDAVFFEDIFPYKREIDKTSGKRTHEMAFRDESPEEPIVNAEIEPRRRQRSRISKSFGPDFIAYVIKSEPQTFQEAMSTPEAQIWKEGINSEIKSILSNHTWELTNLPPSSKPIGCKWIFKRKIEPDGSIDKYKARLVAKGCLLYTSPSPRDRQKSRMPSSA